MCDNWSFKNELLRKSIHICNSLFAYMLFFFNQEKVAVFIGFGAILIISFELLRIRYIKINQIFLKIFGKVTRNFEKDQLTGATYVMISSFLVMFCFDMHVCIASILIMSYADTAAAIIGKKYGTTRIFNKTLEGSFAFFLVAFLIVLSIYPEINLFYSLIAILMATIVELLPLKIDDNFTVPITAALIMSIG